MLHDTHAREHTRTISCPFCARRYRLPESLMGPRGARIRCPRCSGVFLLHIEASDAGTDDRVTRDAQSEADTAAAAPPPRSELERLADRAVASLGAETLAGLAAAHARGRLFAEFGPRLLDAFDRYRSLAGSEADPAPFRQALRDHGGVDVLAERPSDAAKA